MVVGDYGRQGKSGQQQVADAMGVLSVRRLFPAEPIRRQSSAR